MYLTKSSIRDRFSTLAEGQQVRSRDGDNLGKINSMEEEFFTVEKGLFFPKEFTVRYDDIMDVRDGDIYLNLAKEELAPWRQNDYQGWQQTHDYNEGRLNATLSPELHSRLSDKDQDYSNRTDFNATERASRTTDEVTRVPVVEEELEAQKTMQQTGEVRVRKVVHSELRHLTVPVMKEEVQVERVPASGDNLTNVTADAESFAEGTISIPVHEEQVEIVKRPIVKEEVRIRKEQNIEQRDVSGEVRRQDVEIDDSAVADASEDRLDITKKRRTA